MSAARSCASDSTNSPTPIVTHCVLPVTPLKEDSIYYSHSGDFNTGGDMRKILLGVAAAALIAGPAVAADMPVKAIAPLPAAMAYNWSGFYSASGLGSAWWDIKGDYLAPFLGNHHDTTATRFLYSSMVGAQYQWGNVVLGVEGAYNGLYGKSYGTNLSGTSDCFAASANLTCSSRVDGIWTAGGRLGYAWDRLMVFGAGGYADGHLYTQTTVTATGNVSTQTDARHSGWYAGGGFEYFVTKFWMSDLILGAEYQHIDLGTVTHVDLLTGIPSRDMHATVDVVRARIVFKWTPAGGVVARY